VNLVYDTGKLQHIHIRRAMEEILQLGAYRYNIHTSIYRHPDSVSMGSFIPRPNSTISDLAICWSCKVMNTRGAIQNSSLIFQLAQAFSSTAMYATNEFSAVSVPILPADIAMKNIIRLARLPALPRLGATHAIIHSLTPICTVMPFDELASMVEDIGGFRLNRQATMEEFIDAFLSMTKDQQVRERLEEDELVRYMVVMMVLSWQESLKFSLTTECGLVEAN